MAVLERAPGATEARKVDHRLECRDPAARAPVGSFGRGAFWVGGDFWDESAPEYTAPFEIDEMGKKKLSGHFTMTLHRTGGMAAGDRPSRARRA